MRQQGGTPTMYHRPGGCWVYGINRCWASPDGRGLSGLDGLFLDGVFAVLDALVVRSLTAFVPRFVGAGHGESVLQVRSYHILPP